MLIGGKAQLLAICVARNEMLLAARAEFSKNGLLTRAPAAKLTEEGDAFHFVAAVPISVLVELCKRAHFRAASLRFGDCDVVSSWDSKASRRSVAVTNFTSSSVAFKT